MVNVLSMQDMRYINLFSKITRVNTRHFFRYNNMLVFFVPRRLLSKAIGKDAENLRKMSKIVGKRIKVVPQPKDVKEVRSFIEILVNPITFKEVNIKDDKIKITAGRISKSALIGRNKQKLGEMQKIIRAFFKRDFEIA